MYLDLGIPFLPRSQMNKLCCSTLCSFHSIMFFMVPLIVLAHVGLPQVVAVPPPVLPRAMGGPEPLRDVPPLPADTRGGDGDDPGADESLEFL